MIKGLQNLLLQKFPKYSCMRREGWKDLRQELIDLIGEGQASRMPESVYQWGEQAQQDALQFIREVKAEKERKAILEGLGPITEEATPKKQRRAM